MNKDTFYNYIEQPEILDETSLKVLSELLVDYPYFQAAQMLYSKNLHNINHVKYDAQLKLTSAYIYNRKRLFQLINLKPKLNYESNEVVIDDSIVEEKQKDEKEDIVSIEESIINQSVFIEKQQDTSGEIDDVNDDIEQIKSSVEFSEIDQNEVEEQVSITDEIEENIQSINEEVLVDKKAEIIELDENILLNESPELIEEIKEFETESTEINNIIDDNNELIEPEVAETNEEYKIDSECVLQTDEDIKISEEELVDKPLVIENKVEEQFELAETTSKNVSNIAEEILNRVANLKQGLGDNNKEKTESIADIILRKSALAKSKRELENKEQEFKKEENVSENESFEVENIAEVVTNNVEPKEQEYIEEHSSFEPQLDIEQEIVIAETIAEEKIIEDKSEDIEQYYNNADNLSVEKEFNEENINDTVLEIEKQEIVIDSIEDEIIDNTDIIKEEKIDEIKEVVISTETIIKSENLAFNDWFNVLRGSPVKNQEVSKSENSKKLPEHELIERFIKDEPRITPIKNSNIEFNVDISKSVVSESDTFITETLAKIYIKQGYYEKALNIYQKLSLKYSENNTYFAKKIEEVKNLINK